MPKTKKDPSSVPPAGGTTEGKKKVKSSGKGEKVADMSEETVVVDEEELKKQLAEEVKAPASSALRRDGRGGQKVRGKKYQAAKNQINKNTVLGPKEAFELLKKIVEGTKFNQTVEIHLNILTKGLSGEVSLPHFKGKERKIAVFDDGLGTEIKTGKINFDVLLATPADMPKILPLAKILGPKGLMPNPKNGTISPDPKKAIEKFSKGALFFKTEKDFPLIHAAIGKIKQPSKELVANYEAFIKAVNPKNITKSIIKSTMSPAIKVTFL